MKVALVCSHGGHLTEMLCLMEAFEGLDVFYVTYSNPRTETLRYKKYLLKNIGKRPNRIFQALIKFLLIFTKERPKIVVSTGSEIAIPAFSIAKLLRIKTIYIESWCRVRNPSPTGRIVYFLSSVFLVQWPKLLEKYGSKAKYVGAVI